MKSDIASLQDIQFIITKFYEKLLNDELMMPFFEEIVSQNQLGHHIQIIANFWNDILFDSHLYHENVMQKHLQKNAQMRFEKVHFERWTSYFKSTIDEHFDGIQSTNMKNRALSISTIMQLKMQYQ